MFTPSQFGTPALNPFARQRNALASAYRSGIRQIRRASREAGRNGDVGAAIAATKARVELMDQAAARGFNPTGITRYDDRMKSTVDFANSMLKQSQVNQALADRAAKAAMGRPGIPVEQRAADPAAAAAVAPNAEPPAVSFADRTLQAQRRSAAAGVFGRDAQQLAERQTLYSDLKQSLNDGKYLDAAADFQKRAAGLGVSRNAFNRALSRADQEVLDEQEKRKAAAEPVRTKQK